MNSQHLYTALWCLHNSSHPADCVCQCGYYKVKGTLPQQGPHTGLCCICLIPIQPRAWNEQNHAKHWSRLFSDQYFNPEPPAYETEVLATWLQCFTELNTMCKLCKIFASVQLGGRLNVLSVPSYQSIMQLTSQNAMCMEFTIWTYRNILHSITVLSHYNTVHTPCISRPINPAFI